MLFLSWDDGVMLIVGCIDSILGKLIIRCQCEVTAASCVTIVPCFHHLDIEQKSIGVER